MTTLQVRPERSGWRDLRLSAKHREWGWDCPMVDIDFLGLEYHQSKPMVLVEYKHENAPPVDPTRNTSFIALRTLANLAKLPFLLVRYSDDFTTWWVRPLNELAREHLPMQETLTEVDYVALLYRMRDLALPKELRDSLLNQFSLFGSEPEWMKD